MSRKFALHGEERLEDVPNSTEAWACPMRASAARTTRVPRAGSAVTERADQQHSYDNRDNGDQNTSGSSPSVRRQEPGATVEVVGKVATVGAQE
jgi:hypothetical protein